MQTRLFFQRKLAHFEFSRTSHVTWRRCKMPPQRSLCNQRHISLQSLPTLLVPPIIFTGLMLSLWFYKSCMMIAFQNKIIYMPFVPLLARSEKLAEYESRCRPVVWHQHYIESSDRTRIALVVGTSPTPPEAASQGSRKRVIILYFQG